MIHDPFEEKCSRNEIMAQVSKDPLDVSSEFIESAKSLKTNSKKKGGRYSKVEKLKRLDEVYRLHFEYGYSARKISELMKVNRNTINDDIRHWHAKILNNSDILEPEYAITLNIQRFNVQRSRLRESLDKAENFQQRHAIEKMIFDIDSKITNIQMNLSNSIIRVHKQSVETANTWLEKNGRDNRYMTFFDTISVSAKAKQKISDIIKKDRVKPSV